MLANTSAISARLLIVGGMAFVLAFQFLESDVILHAVRSAKDHDNSKKDPTATTTVTLPSFQNSQPMLPSFQNSHPMCQRLVDGFASKHHEQQQQQKQHHSFNASTTSASEPIMPTVLNAGNLWMSHFDEILKASMFPAGKVDDDTANMYRNLLLDVNPSRLQSSLMTYPRSDHLIRIWDILERRRQDPNNHPPLKVLVVGGSVAEGVGCTQGKVASGRACNWSQRLQSFLNHILGKGMVQIINIAQGGTSTKQALSIVKYWMYPDELLANGGGMPDVIIHAFGMNDSHFGPGAHSEKERIEKLFHQGVERLNDFVQTVQKSHPCPTPVIVHLDDYFGGHSQGAMLGDSVYRMVLQEVAGWYQNLAVSSARVLGPLIYPDTSETKLSPGWRMRGGKFNENVHFGYMSHQVVAWSFAYSFLQTAVNYCNGQDWERHAEDKRAEESNPVKSYKTPSVDELQNVMRPPLDYELALHDISSSWKAEKTRQKEHCEHTIQSAPCIMAWVAGPEGRTSNPHTLGSYLKPFATRQGWDFQNDMSHGWSRKLGIVATKVGSWMHLKFANISKPIQVLTVQSLKSYGPKFEGSEAEFVIQKRSKTNTTTAGTSNDEWTPVLKERIQGFHNSTSSISYSTELKLPTQEPIGTDLRVEVTLVGGAEFKITGMMLCAR